jgi:hypothetical protein
MAPKLAELRSRTDRQLVTVVRKQLDRALTLASVAAGADSQIHQRAYREFVQASSLLPKIERLTPDERTELQAKIKQLCRELDGLKTKRTREVAICS